MGCLTFATGAMVRRMRTEMATPRVDVMCVHFACNLFNRHPFCFLIKDLDFQRETKIKNSAYKV